eukprot:g4103.t1
MRVSLIVGLVLLAGGAAAAAAGGASAIDAGDGPLGVRPRRRVDAPADSVVRTAPVAGASSTEAFADVLGASVGGEAYPPPIRPKRRANGQGGGGPSMPALPASFIAHGVCDGQVGARWDEALQICLQEQPVTLVPPFTPCQQNYTVSLPHATKVLSLSVALAADEGKGGGKDITVAYSKAYAAQPGSSTQRALPPTACSKPTAAQPTWQCEVPVHVADSMNYPNVTVSVGVYEDFRQSPDAGGLPCTGASMDLPQSECDAWHDIFDAWNGETWYACNLIRSDPCACKGKEFRRGKTTGVTCSGAHITSM